jgi:predicted nucleic acid-binding protein
MNNRIFADTSALLALSNNKDQYYSEATEKLKDILKTPDTLIITTYILAETVTRIQRKVSKDKAVAVGNMLMQNPRIEIMTPQNFTIQNAWNIYKKYNDQDFSFVDCVSFAAMKELKISRAFAFDKHFTTMKFNLI